MIIITLSWNFPFYLKPVLDLRPPLLSLTHSFPQCTVVHWGPVIYLTRQFPMHSAAGFSILTAPIPEDPPDLFLTPCPWTREKSPYLHQHSEGSGAATVDCGCYSSWAKELSFAFPEGVTRGWKFSNFNDETKRANFDHPTLPFCNRCPNVPPSPCYLLLQPLWWGNNTFLKHIWCEFH